MCANPSDTVTRPPPPRNAEAVPVQGLNTRLAAWAALFRLPNLPSVPGDPLAGGLLAAAALHTAVRWDTLPCAMAASLCLYAAGLLGNDYCDRLEDACERPERPLPSGRIKPGLALVVAAILSAAGAAFGSLAGRAAAVVSVLLLLALWAYNLSRRRTPWLGPALMGACRTLSVLLGAATLGLPALSSLPVIAAAAATGVLILMVTRLAWNETRSVEIGFAKCMGIPFVALAGLSALLFLQPAAGLAGGPVARPAPFPLLLAAMPVIWLSVVVAPLSGRPASSVVQRHIGALIRGLILLQAAYCAAAGPAGEIPALALLAAFAIAGWFGKWLKGS